MAMPLRHLSVGVLKAIANFQHVDTTEVALLLSLGYVNARHVLRSILRQFPNLRGELFHDVLVRIANEVIVLTGSAILRIVPLVLVIEKSAPPRLRRLLHAE